MLLVALEGIKHILKCGAENFKDEQGLNSFAMILDTCGGLDKIE